MHKSVNVAFPNKTITLPSRPQNEKRFSSIENADFVSELHFSRAETHISIRSGEESAPPLKIIPELRAFGIGT
jgi:hypothetical protein